jgi:restriction endonuclease Mrr
LPDEKTEEMHQARVSGLNEKLKELKARISDARKAGKDPFIADMVLRNVNAKIKMAEVTREQRDFDEVEKIIKRAESELEEALKEKELNVKKEVLERLREVIAKETGKVIEG